MRAVVCERYGSPEVLRLTEVERPVPAEDEVLVRVHATTVSRSDCGIRSGTPFIARLFLGLRRPKRRILGQEFAGEVEAVGAAVTEFEVGDRIFGVAGLLRMPAGAHADFVALRESAPLAHMPANMTYEEAGSVCDGAMLALNALRPGNLREGTRILIYGASGSIGTAGVQLARHFGAHVTAVCNTKNVELVRSLGAHEVIDYLREDFTKNGETYDVVFDAVGKHSFRRCRGSLKPGGVYLPTDGWANLFLALATSRIGDKKVRFAIPPRYTKKDVLFLKGLIEAGEYRAVIDRRYPLEDVVEATRYVETEQKTGNVVLTLNGGSAR
jgi:NADPH:quinone reductase-like Zn-dependent oxidoreductase